MPASIQAANSPEIEPREKNLEKEEAASKNGDSKNENNEENFIEEIKESENSTEITQQERFTKNRKKKSEAKLRVKSQNLFWNAYALKIYELTRL